MSNRIVYMGIDTIMEWLVGEDDISEDEFFKYYFTGYDNQIPLEEWVTENDVYDL